MASPTSRVALWGALLAIPACAPSNSREEKPLPIAVIDTTSGQIVERWNAPRRTFDVGFDDITGSVWAVAEDSPDGARVWQIEPEEKPELRLELPLQDSGISVHPFYWLDYGAVSLSLSARRGVFTSPRSESQFLLDLDTGAVVREIISVYMSHGTAFDESRGIGYASRASSPMAFDTSDGRVLGSDFCLPAAAGPALTVTSAGILYAPGYNFNELGDTICRFDPDNGASLLPGGFGCDSHCSPLGALVAPDGSRLFVATPKIDSSDSPSFRVRDLVGIGLVEIDDTAGAQGFELSPDGQTLFVSQIACNRVSVYDGVTYSHRYDIELDGEAVGMDLSADGSLLFVSQADPSGPLGGRKAFLDGQEKDRDLICPPIIPP